MGSLSHIITLFNGDVDLYIVLKDHRIPYFPNTSILLTQPTVTIQVQYNFQAESHFPSSFFHLLQMD